MIIRNLTNEDKDQAKALWQRTFNDPPAFVEWFFEHRYHPEWSAGAFEKGRLISVVHGTPMELSLNDSAFPALMTSGVATVPADRGKGYMHAVMRYLQARADEQGIHALFNHPQRPGSYFRLGFRPSTFTRYWQGKGDLLPGIILPFNEEKAFRVYAELSKRYSCFVRRDRMSFHLKMEDYYSDGAKGFLLEEAGETAGYCIYFEGEDVHGEEVLSVAGYSPILFELKRIAEGKEVYAKLPPDADMPGVIRTQNVMLASEVIWQAVNASNHVCFCVDEY